MFRQNRLGRPWRTTTPVGCGAWRGMPEGIPRSCWARTTTADSVELLLLLVTGHNKPQPIKYSSACPSADLNFKLRHVCGSCFHNAKWHNGHGLTTVWNMVLCSFVLYTDSLSDIEVHHSSAIVHFLSFFGACEAVVTGWDWHSLMAFHLFSAQEVH